MPHRRSVAAANAAADAICALCDGGSIRIYPAPQPATPDDPPAGTLLAEPTFSATAFAPAAGGVAVANAIADDASASGSGDAAWYRLCRPDGSAVTDDECGLTGSGKGLELLSLTITAGARVVVTAFSHTEPTT